MKTVPKLDPVADGQRQVELKQLAIGQNATPFITHAGVANSALSLQSQRYHALRGAGRAAIANIGPSDIDFHQRLSLGPGKRESVGYISMMHRKRKSDTGNKLLEPIHALNDAAVSHGGGNQGTPLQWLFE